MGKDTIRKKIPYRIFNETTVVITSYTGRNKVF